MPHTRLSKLTAFMHARLSQGYLGIHLTVGMLLLIFAGSIFADIAIDVVRADDITIVDEQIAQWFHLHASLPLTRFMLAVTHLHGTVGILLLAAMAALFMRWKKEYYWALTVALAVPGGMLFNMFLKQVFQRARPVFESPLLELTTFSFPSGHAASATLLYGVLAAYLVCRIKPWRWRIAIATLAVFLVCLVGLSRIYLGVHYLSDVLAAIASSSAWLTVCLSLVASIRRRREHSAVCA